MLLCGSLGSLKTLGKDSSSVTPSKKWNIVSPEKAWLVYTEASWGTIHEQNLISNPTLSLKAEDGRFVSLESPFNPTDVAKREELYVSFSAQKINQLPGYYVIKLTPISGIENSVVNIDYLDIKTFDGKLVLTIDVSTAIPIEVRFLYSFAPGLRNLWSHTKRGDHLFSSSRFYAFKFYSSIYLEKGKRGLLYELNKLKMLLEERPPKGIFDDPLTFPLKDTVYIPLKTSYFNKDSVNIMRSVKLFEKLSAELSIKGKLNFWSERAIQKGVLKKIVSEFRQTFSSNDKNYRINIVLSYYNPKRRVVIGKNIGGDLLYPLAIRLPSGRVVPGKVKIMISENF